MLIYDAINKELTLCKVKNPDMGSRFDLLKDVRESYADFLDNRLLDVMELINTSLRDDYGESRKLQFTTEKAPGVRGEEDRIRVMAKVPGRPATTAIPVVTLPYMDNLGKLHFHDRSVKSVVNKIASADDLSYDMSRSSLSIVLKKRTIKVDCSSKTFDFKVLGRKGKQIRLADLIIYLAHLEGEDKDIHNLIRNPTLQAALQNTDRMSAGYRIPYQTFIDNDIENGSQLLDKLINDEDYRIGNVRDSLNAAVSLDRAMGEVLSRPVLTYSAGTYITPAVLQDIKKHKINQIYIKTLIPAPTKKINGSLIPYKRHLQYTMLHKGMEVGDFIRENVSSLAEFDIVPEDTMLGEGDWSMNGQYATRALLEFIRDAGEPGVCLGDKRIPYPFETEVIGNYTLQYKDVFSDEECLARNVDPKAWFCYKDNPTCQSDYRREKLSSDDLLAIYSTLGYMLLRNVNLFMDRDRDFLKKVELVDVAVEKALTKAIRTHMRTFGQYVVKYIKDGVSQKSGVNIFSGLSDTLRKTMGADAEATTETSDTTNYVAELSQATHITNRMKEAPEVMRQIATPYYGRICPFETPEGNQLGLVNNKAIGCHIVDGNMFVPVRKVLHEGNRIRISDNITEVSVKQEVQLRITDILQLVPDKDEGYYQNTRVIAKVPNPDPNGERLVFANVYAEDLDYVYAHTEEFISVTTSLIPCASSDDAVRVSFGSKMIKSAIYLLDPDVPRVSTFMYRSIFDSSEAYLIRARKSGTVIDVSKGMLTVMYDGDSDETNYKTDEFKVTKDSVVFMRYKVKQGDRFTQGEVLVDCSASQEGVYCPGKNEPVAYMSTGYNYEDAIQVGDRATIDFISIGSNTISRKRGRDSKINTTNMYKYFKRGDVVTDVTTVTEKGDKITESIVSNHGSGIWYSWGEVLQGGQMVYKIDLMGYNRLQVGDKMSGRHGNKGVVARVSPNSEMPMLANGMPVRMLLNPHGLPSRMNTGQVLEAHLGLVANVLNITIRSDSFNGASHAEVQYLMELAHELANAPSDEAGVAIARKYNLDEGLVEHIAEQMPKIRDWAGVFDKYGDAYLWNPVTMEWFPFPITIGFPYILKMKQEAETKIHVRAGLLEETYMTTSGQPTKGESMGGGQSIGEMELAAIAAYGASELLYEMCNAKSDNEVERVNQVLSSIDSPLRVPEKYAAPRSVMNLMYVLESFGLILEDSEQKLPDVSYETARESYVYDVKKLIKEKETASLYVAKETSNVSTTNMVEELMKVLF